MGDGARRTELTSHEKLLRGAFRKNHHMSVCPRCTASLNAYDFQCPRCTFQVVDACPQCHRKISIDAYQEVTSDLWACPACRSHIRARYAEPMITDRGDLVEPLVRLTLAWQCAEAWATWQGMKAGDVREVSQSEIDAEFEIAKI